MRIDNDDLIDIENATFIDSISAAYTVYEAMMEGTKKKKMSKEDFMEIYTHNIEDFTVIIERKIAKDNK